MNRTRLAAIGVALMTAMGPSLARAQARTPAQEPSGYDTVLSTLTHPPAGADGEHLTQLATRGRGLLAHGVGRLTIHALGRRLGIADESAFSDAVRRAVDSDRP